MSWMLLRGLFVASLDALGLIGAGSKQRVA